MEDKYEQYIEQKKIFVEFWKRFSLALFASLQFNCDTTTGKMLGPATSLSQKDGGIAFSVLPNDTTSKVSDSF